MPDEQQKDPNPAPPDEAERPARPNGGVPAELSARVGDGVEALLGAFDNRLAARVDDAATRIVAAFDEKLRYDASKEAIIDRQHEELQRHRAGLVEQAASPFILGMTRLHAQIGRLLRAYEGGEAPEEMSRADVYGLLDGFRDEVESILGENGIAAYRGDVGDPFDPSRHTVAGEPEPTGNEERSGTVAKCLGAGFERDGRIVVKASVSVYRYESETQEETRP